jgi:hypothetical protein
MTLALLIRYWRYAAGAAILALLWWQLHSYGSRQYQSGQAQVQARWDAANVQAHAVAAAETRKRELQDAADAARNVEIENAHAKELAAAVAGRDRYVSLLQRAREAANRCPAPGLAGQPAATDPGPPRSPEPARTPAEFAAAIDAAIADLMAEARQNASQLDSLIAQIRPQL